MSTRAAVNTEFRPGGALRSQHAISNNSANALVDMASVAWYRSKIDNKPQTWSQAVDKDRHDRQPQSRTLEAMIVMLCLVLTTVVHPAEFPAADPSLGCERHSCDVAEGHRESQTRPSARVMPAKHGVLVRPDSEQARNRCAVRIQNLCRSVRSQS